VDRSWSPASIAGVQVSGTRLPLVMLWVIWTTAKTPDTLLDDPALVAISLRAPRGIASHMLAGIVPARAMSLPTAASDGARDTDGGLSQEPPDNAAAVFGP